jgi:hypothetical protein
MHLIPEMKLNFYNEPLNRTTLPKTQAHVKSSEGK